LRGLAVVGACLALTALYGCGGGDSTKATVSGKVTYKGAPVPSGTITLYPASGPEYPIILRPDGTFNTSDVPVGPMGVGISTPPAMAMPAGTDQSAMGKVVPIPAKYKDPKTSGLTWDVTGGKQSKNFELTD
jgi:hypothetical protein